MQPCLSETLTLPCTFAEDVGHCAAAGCAGLEVWLTKLENHLESQSLAQTRRLLEERGVRLAAAAYQGGLLLSQGEERRAHFDHFRKRLEICQQLGIPTVLLAADFVHKVQSADLERAVVSLAQAAQWAAGFGVRLALEFRGRDTFCASLDTALALALGCGEDNVGINFDVFHYYTGPSKLEDLAALPPERLYHVQLCDLAGVAREAATDGDRILPGEGDFQLQPILAQLRRLKYEGWVSAELMNPMLWRADPGQLTGAALTALRRCLSAG